MNRPTFPVGVDVFVVRDRKLLLGTRIGTGYMDHTWGLPGGHLELQETMKGCAARELMEETGMMAEDFEFHSVVNDTARAPAHYVHVNFVAKHPQGEHEVKEPDRCTQWQWFSFDALPKDIFPGHAKQIELFISDKNGFTET